MGGLPWAILLILVVAKIITLLDGEINQCTYYLRKCTGFILLNTLYIDRDFRLKV